MCLVPYSTKRHICSMAVLSRTPELSLLSTGRWALTVVAFPLCCSLMAQKAGEIDYSIHLEPAFNGSEVKFVLEALRANDPGCLVWPDAPTQRVIVRTTVPLDESALEQHIASAGLHVVGVDLVLPDDPQERKAMIMASEGFPVYSDTGHPEQDQANYSTAKSAWINADPTRYERLMRALNPALPQER